MTCVCFAACGGGGGGGSSDGSTGTALGAVQLLAHSPADGEVQVPANKVIQLEFDAAMAVESFGDEDTWLRKVGTTENVAGSFARGAGGRVSFTPSQPLALETDYEFHLSGLTSDQTGRILDAEASFSFRTFDSTRPQLTSIDVADNSVDQSRTRTFTLTFTEQLGAASVTEQNLYLRDVFGFRYSAIRTIDGPRVILDPQADLPGDRQFFVIATDNLADRAGNTLAASSTTRFRTEQDPIAPRVVTVWPPSGSTDISPRVQPTFTFDESMDPATVEAASLLFQDQFGSVVPFAIESSKDQRTLRIRPTVTLQQDRNYTMAFLLGGAAATDVSGNILQATQAMTFRTGRDAAPAVLVTSTPAAGENRVPASVIASLVFDEAMDPAWIDTDTVTLTAGGEPWVAVVELAAPTVLRVTPVEALPLNTTCKLTVRGGHEGVRDVAGNVWPDDLTLTFTTSADAGMPNVVLLPPEGAAGVAPTSHARFVFDAPMDRATLTASTLLVTTDGGLPVPGTLSIDASNRIVQFTPTTAFAPLTYYRLRVVAGGLGARRASGNWFTTDQNARFRTGTANDTTAPQVTLSVNRIPASRSTGLLLPPSGFTIEIAATDANSQWADMSSVELVATGPGGAPSISAMMSSATFGYGTFAATVPANASFGEGTWTISARVADLSGNVGTSAPLDVAITAPTGQIVPFERTQVVWVRADLDRNNNGVADFDDDMLRLGFAKAGDPLGTNARMKNLVLDGILACANRLCGRGDRGEPIDEGSVALRFSKRQPIAVVHMQMALGGYDPEGSGGRDYGDDSTGVLGRAYYDYRNGNPAERNIVTSPGLGVFPGEMWLYQTKIHIQVWPSFQTTFAQKFRPLCPDMGGTPAGGDPLDAIVLAANFDYATANNAQRARWQTIMDAADDWSTVIGIILAHEVGHSVGLVAPGAAPVGLFGDASLHDSFSSAAEVMAASVGYEAMTSLDYHFRDIDLAYLRQRVLLR